MNKHTPGPWEIVPVQKKHGGVAYRIRQAAPRYPLSTVVPDARLLIAETYAHRFGSADGVPGDTMRDLADSEREGCQIANAQLIAAAPDLLAAIKKLVRRSDNGDTIEPGWYEIEAAREIIAKAEGGA